MEQKKKIERFTDLFAWQKGHALVIAIYEITKKFPQGEQYGLTSQLRRAAVSLTSNIAEGFSRKSYKEKTQFYAISLGSLTELQNQILIARDVHYIPQNDFEILAEHAIIVNKLLNGLIKSSKERIHNN